MWEHSQRWFHSASCPHLLRCISMILYTVSTIFPHPDISKLSCNAHFLTKTCRLVYRWEHCPRHCVKLNNSTIHGSEFTVWMMIEERKLSPQKLWLVPWCYPLYHTKIYYWYIFTCNEHCICCWYFWIIYQEFSERSRSKMYASTYVSLGQYFSVSSGNSIERKSIVYDN